MDDIIPMIFLGRRDSSLSDRVAQALGERILFGDLLPGAKLPTEAELGDLFAVSRSVVRDAIRTLSARGLVQVRHGYGMVVASPSDSTYGDAVVVLLLRSELTVGDILDARAAIEVGVCPAVVKRSTAADWSQLDGDLDRLAVAVKDREWEEALREHLAFHLDLLRSTHLPAMEMMLRPIHHVVLLSSLPPVADDPELWELPGHRRILDALRARSHEAVREALLDHYKLMLEGDAYAELRQTRFRDSPTVSRVLGRGWLSRPDPHESLAGRKAETTDGRGGIFTK
jgi:GntR family transcriptional repressor for pyruvate dehydrogenase complex